MTPMTLLWNGDSSRRKELQAKALRRRRCVIPTNDTSMTPMTLAPFAVSSEVSELGRCHRRRKGSKGREGRVLALRHVYRHLLGAPDDHQLTFSKSETPCESWQACFRISVRGIKRG